MPGAASETLSDFGGFHMTTVRIDHQHSRPCWVGMFSDDGKMVFGTKYVLKDDVRDWLARNCEGFWDYDQNFNLKFKKETDAVAFKMFWF
jgi:hypothetical protein